MRAAVLCGAGRHNARLHLNVTRACLHVRILCVPDNAEDVLYRSHESAYVQGIYTAVYGPKYNDASNVICSSGGSTHDLSTNRVISIDMQGGS